MALLVTSKYEEDPIKIECARVATTQNNDFSNTEGQLIRTHPTYYICIIIVLVTCKNEEDPPKNNGAIVATTFFPL